MPVKRISDSSRPAGLLALFMLAAVAAFLAARVADSVAHDDAEETFIVEGSLHGTPFPDPEPVSEAELDEALQAVSVVKEFGAVLEAGYSVEGAHRWAREPGDYVGIVITIALESPFRGEFSGRGIEWIGEGKDYRSADEVASFESIQIVEVFYDQDKSVVAAFRPGVGSVLTSPPSGSAPLGPE